jgi:branched-chain amino acid transport system permease protein
MAAAALGRGRRLSWDIALILGMDGLANGAVYLLAGLGLVLIFSVTRVVFVPFGDIAAFAALTMAAFETGRMPPTIGLVLCLAALAVATEVTSRLRRKERRGMTRAVAAWGLLPLLPCLAAWAASRPGVPQALQVVVSVLLVVPIAPLLARIVFQPIADASVLVLLIVSLALHFLVSGLGLLFFGPEGSRTAPLWKGAVALAPGFSVSGQVVLMIAAALVLSGLFFLVFERTLAGKALRATAVNRIGARLVGIRPARTALLAYGCASLLAGLIGVLIAPATTMYYDSGFIIGLKAFVAAIIGGLVSYPGTAAGALAVGLVESFASFWSGALKDVIVFSLLIPVLMLRSFLTAHAEEEEEEIDA